MRVLASQTCVLVLTLIFAAEFPSAACGQSADSKEEPQIVWRSESINDAQLAESIERLYLSLYNTGALRTKQVQIGSNDNVEALLRSSDLFFGSYFPQSLDAMLCDLNTDMCNRPRRPVTDQNISNHVGGFAPTAGEWRLTATSMINVPDYTFEPYTALGQVTVSTQKDLSAASEQKTGNCQQWGSACDALVKTLNPHVFASKDGVKLDFKNPVQLVVPVTGWSTKLPVTVDNNSALAGQFQNFDPRIKVQQSLPGNIGEIFSDSWKKSLETNSPTDFWVESLEKNLQPWMKGSPMSSHDSATERAVMTAKMANHPLGLDKPLGEAFAQPISIAVFDNAFQAGSCAMAKKISVLTSATNVQSASNGNATKCGVNLGMANPISDHGTHVVGIIAATHEDEGIVGLNAAARIVFTPVDTVQLNSSPAYLDNLYNLMIFSGIQNKVTNISWGYERTAGHVDRIRDAMKALKTNSLYVVAAGNSGQHHDRGNCRGELPACFTDLSNVMTVVGLDASANPPTLWQGENGQGSDSSEEFHIAAMAKSVPSILANGDVGFLSGTSQAAPQVSAAASLLFSVHAASYADVVEWLPPERVKNRLMYSADIFPSLLSHVFSGKLNIEKAVSVKDSSVEYLDDSGQIRKERGIVTPENANLEVLCQFADGSDLFVKWFDINRMFFDSERSRFVLFFNSKKGDRSSRLARVTDCQLMSQSQNLQLNTGLPAMSTIRIGNLRDYIAPMF